MNYSILKKQFQNLLNPFYLLTLIFFLSMGCATNRMSQPDFGSEKIIILEFIKKTNNSSTHNSDWATAVGNEVANSLQKFDINTIRPSAVDSEFTSRGNIDLVKSGINVARREKKNLILFLDLQVNKRGNTPNGQRLAFIKISSWFIDAKTKKQIFAINKEGIKKIDTGSNFSAVNRTIKKAAIKIAENLSNTINPLIGNYLSVMNYGN